jgi:hypothetical protein
VLRFARLWAVVFFGYITLKAAFYFAGFRLIDLRGVALAEALFVSFGQSLLLWVITGRPRRSVEQSDQTRLADRSTRSSDA